MPRKNASTKSKSHELIYYVYVLMDKSEIGPFAYGDYLFKYKPIYIGKGKTNRSEHHVQNAFVKREDGSFKYDTLKDRKIRKIIRTGGSVSVRRSKQMTNDADASAKEINLIAAIGRRDLGRGPLCNMTNGGDGGSGFVKSERTLAKASKSMKKVWSHKDAKDRRLIAEKVSKGNIATWATKTDADVIARTRKRKATEANMKRIRCPYCGYSNVRRGMMKSFHFKNCKWFGYDPEYVKTRLHGTILEKKALTSEKMVEICSRRPTVSCPHCGKLGKGPVMYKWHFDNCKHK